MSADRYPRIFSREMYAIVYRVHIVLLDHARFTLLLSNFNYFKRYLKSNA